MGLFRKMFRRDNTDTDLAVHDPLPPASATPRRIGHDPKLIEALRNDHARLGTLFGRIEKTAKTGDYHEVRTLLAHFKSSLQAHILSENVRFYTYVEEQTADDPESARVMHEFRRDMNSIARQVVDFVKKYQNSDFASHAEREQFDRDYAAVGELLAQRLDSEENDLYPLYMPG